MIPALYCILITLLFLYSRSLLLFLGPLSVKSRLAAYRKMFFSFPSRPSTTTFDGVHRISFLSALARALSFSLPGIQYVSCAYARKFKYLLFVIKFGRASRMGILHRDCAMQRDGSSLSVRGNGDLRIDRYFILLLPHLVPVYRFSLDSLSLFCFSFPVSHESRGSSGRTCVVPRAQRSRSTPLRLLTLTLIFLLLSFDTPFLILISLKV